MWEQVESLSKGSMGQLWQTLVIERDGELRRVEGIEDWIFLSLVSFARRQSPPIFSLRWCANPALFGFKQNCVRSIIKLMTQ